MCGRYASSRPAGDLSAYFEVDAPAEEVLPPSYNVAPTDPVYAVLQRAQVRQLRVVRWGLVPSWAKDPKVGARFINARRETVRDKPAFRAAFARRRCLVPADGYYEWQRQEAGKQPYFLSSVADEPLAMAGLYEVWKSPEGSYLWTCTVLTTQAADELGHIHDRTPLTVPRAAWATWLAPDIENPGTDLLRPGTPGQLQAWPVGPAVGNVGNNGPDLLTPLEPAAPAPISLSEPHPPSIG